MRPRLLHLGSPAIFTGSVKGLLGFNEAEAFTPRILRPKLPSLSRSSGFNEAEAFTPRIQGCRRLWMCGGALRFNEAEAFTPRIHGFANRPDTI